MEKAMRDKIKSQIENNYRDMAEQNDVLYIMIESAEDWKNDAERKAYLELLDLIDHVMGTLEELADDLGVSF